jgi:hypothetical protein
MKIKMKLFYSIKFKPYRVPWGFFDLKLEPIDSLLISFTIVSALSLNVITNALLTKLPLC